MNKILLIEDDIGKSDEIERYLVSEFKPNQILTARSFRSGLISLVKAKDVDCVILDMSMPSFDISANEPLGGSPESFAGKELLAQMRLRSINIPTIVVTMYDVFGEEPNKISLDNLMKDLESNYSPPFIGLVYYNSQQEGWRKELKNLILNKIKG